MTLEESGKVIPILEDLISQCEAQQELLSEMYGDLVNLDQQLQNLEGECQNWYELASKLSAENRALLRQNEELLKLSKR